MNQRLDFEQLDDVVNRELLVAIRAIPIEQVLAHGQVRKQRQVLRHVTYAAPPSRNEDVFAGVSKNLITELDEGGLGASESRHEIKQ